MTAQASSTTTYGLDLTISNMDFDGTFTFNKSGNCTASSLLCAKGSTPDLSQVHVSDGFNGSAFTQAAFSQSGNGEHVTLYDLNGSAGLSSSAILLSFNINGTLGSASQYSLSNILLNVDNNVTGTFSCGGATKCTSSLKAVAAPEMDVASTGAAAGLLLGALAILGGGRLRVRNR